MKIFSLIILVLSSILITAGATARRLAETGTIVLMPSPAVAQPTTAPAPTQENSEPAREDRSLNDLVNAYRSANGRSALGSNGTLCMIATVRMGQLSAAGGLDNHAGFEGQARSQKEFSNMGEILQYRWPPASNESIVYTGWVGSREHEVVLLAPGWTHGCGATNGSFAVFIFGMK